MREAVRWVSAIVIILFLATLISMCQERASAMPACRDTVTSIDSANRCISVPKRKFRRHLKAGNFGNAHGVKIPKQAIRQAKKAAGRTVEGRDGFSLGWLDRAMEWKSCLAGGGLANALLRGDVRAGQGCSQTAHDLHHVGKTAQTATTGAALSCGGAAITFVTSHWRLIEQGTVNEHWVFVGWKKEVLTKSWVGYAICTTTLTYRNVLEMARLQND